jgi:hypothetical protein
MVFSDTVDPAAGGDSSCIADILEILTVSVFKDSILKVVDSKNL